MSDNVSDNNISVASSVVASSAASSSGSNAQKEKQSEKLEKNERPAWNPTMPFLNDDNGETYSHWLAHFRDLGGKLHKQKPPRIFVILEGNQSGRYWRLLWPKSAEKPEEQWWQAMRIEPHADNEPEQTMRTIQDGAEIAIEGIKGRVERRAEDKICFWFVTHKE
jgi:hypothetical protein